ncbi:luminal binding protein 5, partial [Tanacetum coccineum]
GDDEYERSITWLSYLFARPEVTYMVDSENIRSMSAMGVARLAADGRQIAARAIRRRKKRQLLLAHVLEVNIRVLYVNQLLAVIITDSERLIGDDVKNQATVNDGKTIVDVKRLIGRKFEDKEVQRDSKLLPYKIVTKDGNPYIQV